MKWTKGTYKIACGKNMPNTREGYVSGPWGLCMEGRRNWILTHIPSGYNATPQWLKLTNREMAEEWCADLASIGPWKFTDGEGRAAARHMMTLFRGSEVHKKWSKRAYAA